MPKESVLSLNAMEKLLRSAGALRVSEDAKEALAKVLEKKANEVSLKAIKFAEHAGRKTVIDKDIQLATQ